MMRDASICGLGQAAPEPAALRAQVFSGGAQMSDAITFTLNGKEVAAAPGETIWQVAERQGIEIPHLCYLPEPGYRADGNCRACMVEIEGERVLAASCIRKPATRAWWSTTASAAGQEVPRDGLRAADGRPARSASVAHDPNSRFWDWADKHGHRRQPLPGPGGRCRAGLLATTPSPSTWTPASTATLCVRACREVQVNDVIGMAYRGHGAKVVFDFDQPMGDSTCVACGECVQACPTGALMEANLLDEQRRADGISRSATVDTLCPYCGVGCQTTVHVKDDKILYVDGRNGPANEQRLAFRPVPELLVQSPSCRCLPL